MAAWQYLQSLPPETDPLQILDNVNQRLAQLQHPVVSKDEVWKIEAAEQVVIEEQGVDGFKFASNDEMLELLNKSS